MCGTGPDDLGETRRIASTPVAVAATDGESFGLVGIEQPKARLALDYGLS